MGLFGSKNTGNPFAGRELLCLELTVEGLDSTGFTILANPTIRAVSNEIKGRGKLWHYFQNNNFKEELRGQGDWGIAIVSAPQHSDWSPWGGFGVAIFMSGPRNNPFITLQLGRDGFDAFLSEIRWKKPGRISVYGVKSDLGGDSGRDEYIVHEVRLY
jgi:hypothetical protein